MKALGYFFMTVGYLATVFVFSFGIMGLIYDVGILLVILMCLFLWLFMGFPFLLLGRYCLMKNGGQRVSIFGLKIDLNNNFLDRFNAYVNTQKDKVNTSFIDKAKTNSTTKINDLKQEVHVKENYAVDYEIKLIKLAKENDGYVSRVDVVLAFNIPSKKAQFIIDELYAEGLFDIHLTKNGSTLYKLRNYCSAEERETASSLLD